MAQTLNESWQQAFHTLNRSDSTPAPPGIQGLLATCSAWAAVKRDLAPRHPDRMNLEGADGQELSEELHQAVQLLFQVGLRRAFTDWYLEAARDAFDSVAAEVFALIGADEGGHLIPRLVETLSRWLAQWERPLIIFNDIPSLRAQFSAALHGRIGTSFLRKLHAYLFTHFEHADPMLGRALAAIGLRERFEGILAACTYERIEARASEAADQAHGFETAVLDDLLSWLAASEIQALAAWHESADSQHSQSFAESWSPRLEYHLCKIVSDVRASQIFDLISEYPESAPALSDLETCLQHTDQKQVVARALASSLKHRLLHPGAGTKDIIAMYVNAVRSMRKVDPSGVILSRVVEPLRRYLRGRSDTISSIVSSLLGEDDQFRALREELEHGDPATFTVQVSPDGEEIEDYTDPDWEPEPVDAGPNYRATRRNDIISMLVSIFDDKEGFITALEKSSADQLIKIKNYDTEKEYRNNMILKKRFGDISLGKCDVMLSDIADSRRIDNNIHQSILQAEQPDIPLHATIASRQFWPELDVTTLKMPGQFAKAMEVYEREYIRVKDTRKLSWLPNQGSVTIEVELQDRKVDLEVNNIQAAVVELFSEKSPRTSDEVASVLEVDSSSALNAIYFWVNQGVLKDLGSGSFETIEKEEGSGTVQQTRTVVEDDRPAVKTTEEVEAESQEKYLAVMYNMLRSLGPQQSQRLWMACKMMTQYTRPLNEFEAWLGALQAQGTLRSAGPGLWALQLDQ